MRDRANEGESVPGRDRSWRRWLGRRGPGARTVAAAGVAACLAASVFVATVPLSAGAAPARQVRLAVMELSLAGGGPEAAGLGAGLQSMLTTDLANAANLVLVERARLRDVTAELKLGGSRLVDPATAAKVGKVVGASHLLTGSVTIAGGKMRIDARLVEVATARVVLGESIEGQADVFFELEKSLMRKLLDAVAVEITPKERGAMAKVQTADLDAFRKYGLGLKLFDDKKYDQAVKTLREASDRDADFSLARSTLAEYERLVAGLRREADVLDQQSAVENARQVNQALTEEQKMIAKLFEAADRKGDRARDQRLTALYLLAKIYGGRRDSSGLAAGEDRFAWERTTDAIYQRYLAESLGAFPRFPALINNIDDQGYWKLKMPASATFAADLERLTGELKEFGVRLKWKDDEEKARRYHRQRSLTLDRRENAARLHLDLRGEADLEDRLDALLAREDPEYLKAHPESVLGRSALRREILDLDGSTKLIVGLRGNKADAGWLRRLADSTEANARLKALLEAGGGADKAKRELVMMWLADMGVNAERFLDRMEEDLKKSFTASGQLTERGARDLTDGRLFRDKHGNNKGMVVIGNHPVWRVVGEPFTGPRRDPRRADEIRYFRSVEEKQDLFTLLIVDGVPRRDLQARFQVELGAPPVDFQPERGWTRPYDRSGGPPPAVVAGPDVGRPAVTFVFGLRDVARVVTDDRDEGGAGAVETASSRGRSGGGRGEKRTVPMRALGLRLEGGRATLVDLTRPGFAGDRFPRELALQAKALAEHGLARGGATKVDVSLRVEGKKLTATVGGDTFELVLSRADAGFYGFVIEQPGYVAIRQLEAGALR